MKYSIITCTYNAEQHLDKYFKNINDINYDDFEVIVVDDFSTDHTYIRLTKHARKSKKKVIIYKHETNRGPGVARNTGLRHVTGEKVVFLDVDDEIDKNLFLILDNYIGFDIILFDYFRKYQGNVLKNSSTLSLNEGKIADIDKVLKTVNGSVWGKLFVTDIIKKNNIRFPDLLKSEDLVFLISYLSSCETAYYLKQPLYYYTISSSSLMHRNIENQVKYAYEAIALIRRLPIGEDVKKLLYCREIVYDISNIYLLLGKKKNFMLEFWTEHPLPTRWRLLKNYLRTSHYLMLSLIDNHNYYTLKFFVRVKNIFS